jgi:hypothetical protein
MEIAGPVKQRQAGTPVTNMKKSGYRIPKRDAESLLRVTSTENIYGLAFLSTMSACQRL